MQAEKEAKKACLAHEAERARETRKKQRHLVAAEGALVRSILDLTDRLDSSEGRGDAGQELVELARLHPSAFTDDLLRLLMADALVADLGACMEATVVVHELDGRPEPEEIVPKAFECLTKGIAAAACGRVIARYASREDVLANPGAFRQVVALAGPIEHPFRENHVESQTEALKRIHEVAQSWTERRLGQELVDAEPSVRASASNAVVALHDCGLQCGLAVLPRLLDAMRMGCAEGPSDYPDTEYCAIEAIGRVLLDLPTEAESLLSDAWTHSDNEEKMALLRAYDAGLRAARDGGDNQEFEVAAFKRALSCLLNERDALVVGAAGDVLVDVCDSQSHAVDLPLDNLLGGLAILADKESPTPPTDAQFIDVLELHSQQVARQSACRHLCDAAVAVGTQRPDDLWQLLYSFWQKDDIGTGFRSHIVEIAGSLSCAKPHAREGAFPHVLGNAGC